MMWFLLVILVAAVAVVGVIVIEKRRTAQLRQRFGPEYELALEKHGARRAAETDLRHRLERRRNAEVRELSPKERDRLCARWREVQVSFVDDPQASVAAAAGLVERVMVVRGYLSDGTSDRRDGAVDHGAADHGAADGEVARREDEDRVIGDGRVDRRGLDGARPDADDRGFGEGTGDGRADDGPPDRYELVTVDHPILVGRFRSAPRVGTGSDGLGDAPAMSADELRGLFLQHNELFEALVGGSPTSRSHEVEEVRS